MLSCVGPAVKPFSIKIQKCSRKAAPEAGYILLMSLAEHSIFKESFSFDPSSFSEPTKTGKFRQQNSGPSEFTNNPAGSNSIS